MQDMMPVFIVAICFFSFIAFVKIVSDNKIRHKLIEKGMVDEKAKFLYANRFEHQGPGSMKWGFVLIGVGLAFIMGQFFPDISGEITIGCMFLFAGLGLILYYIFAKRMVHPTEK